MARHDTASRKPSQKKASKKLNIGILVLLIISFYYLLYFKNASTELSEYQEKRFSDWVKIKPEMDNPEFVEFVRKNYLIQPSTKPYNLSANIQKDPSAGQLEIVRPYLSKMPGFFIECGAADGEFLSNTLYLEKEEGWTGLLVEAGSTYFQKLVTKNRKAWLSNTCLSTEKYPIVGTFYQAPGKPYLNGLNVPGLNSSAQINCIPLYTLLLALKRTVVDFLSLDVERSEMTILKTVPFDKLIFKAIVMEYGAGRDIEEMKTFMGSKGYVFRKFIRKTTDLVFTHQSVKV